MMVSVERPVGDSVIPVPVTLTGADRRTVTEIADILRAAREHPMSHEGDLAGASVLTRRARLGERDGLVWLEARLGLHNRLSAAAEGVGEWPGAERYAPVFAWRGLRGATPIAFGPLLLVDPEGKRAHFNRAATRFTAADGRTGLGWIEWNQVQP